MKAGPMPEEAGGASFLRHMARAFLPLCLLLWPDPAAAQGPEAEDLANTTALRLSAASGLLDYGEIGVEVSQVIKPWLAIDGMLGYADFGYGNGGLAFELLARGGSFWSRHAVSLGLGPAVLAASSYGPVTLLQSELSYEYRHHFAFLIGVGPSLALNTSQQAACNQGGLLPCLFLKQQFHRGELGWRARLGLGLSF